MVGSRRLETDPRVRKLLGDVGRPLEEIVTPALVLDPAVARRNIETMAARMAALPAGLRPHIKVHKSAELARLQLDAGALGVTTATVAEAVAMAEAGVPDVLVASEVVSPVAIARLAEAARTARIRVAVDDAGVLAATGRAAVGGGRRAGGPRRRGRRPRARRARGASRRRCAWPSARRRPTASPSTG